MNFSKLITSLGLGLILSSNCLFAQQSLRERIERDPLVAAGNNKGEVLVHFDLNEKEAGLPIEPYRSAGKPESGKFYLWSSVKAYWEGILEHSPVK
ncbi:MAG: hypothetical protein ACI3Y7_02590 [Candidatus Cryptobacteroides sp.]